jgi:hypothetical protein
MQSLSTVLSTTLHQIWPSRRDQERLLDLGENKKWGEAERDEAIARLATWLNDALGLPTNLPCLSAERVLHIADLADLPIPSIDGGPGIARRVAGLAQLCGCAPKTLANSLGGGLRPDRRDHRWILAHIRCVAAPPAADALLYHRRDPASVTTALAAMGARTQPDAADATLLLSLVALWQRRRPTAEARAARGRVMPRREVPKPAAGLQGELIQPSQYKPLLQFASRLEPGAGRLLGALTVESALAGAHLLPHRTRAPDVVHAAAALRHLDEVDGLLQDAAHRRLIGEVDTDAFAWRIDRMRAFTQGVEFAPHCPPPELPHVHLVAAMEAVRKGAPVSGAFSPQTPGCLMLLPQARRLGLLKEDP